MKRFRSLGRAGGFLAWCCHDEFLHLKQPLWCQCTGRIGEMSRESRGDKEDRKIGAFSFTQWSFTFMDGHIRQHQGIYQTIVNMTQTCLNPKSSGSRERPGTMWHKPNRFLLSATQAAAPGAYRLLILCLSLCLSVSLSLSLSLTHTHTQDTVIVMLCFLLESLNPSLTSPDLPENWKMWMVWEYGCFFYSEVKYFHTLV